MASTTHAKCQPSQRIVNTRCQLLHTVICGDCANFKTVGKTVSAPLCRRHCFYPGLNALADTTVVPPDGAQTSRSSISRTMDVVAAMPLQRFHEVVVKHKYDRQCSQSPAPLAALQSVTSTSTIPCDDPLMFTLDRFFTAIRVIDVSHAENLLMFGEKRSEMNTSKRYSLNAYRTTEGQRRSYPGVHSYSKPSRGKGSVFGAKGFYRLSSSSVELSDRP